MTKQQANHPGLATLGAALGVVWLVASSTSFARAANVITEPSTIFYGKVLDLGSGLVLHEGELTWLIRRADGVNQILRTELYPLKDGEYSYQLNVPHQALSLGLQPLDQGVPLRANEESHTHLLMGVNGKVATILGPGGAAFDAAQARRTATYRLDLALNLADMDLDGNGLPDWWESMNQVTDANGDGDNDGLNNLAEYVNGSNPNQDDRVPSLATTEIRVYAEGTTIVRLRAIDSDSPAEALVYTLTGLPEAGVLYLRNANAGGSPPDVALGLDSGFTQADVDAGRVVFVNQSTNGSPFITTFEVGLADEDPTHAVSVNPVTVTEYKPSMAVSATDIPSPTNGLPVGLPAVAGFPAEEQRFVGSFLLSKELAYVVSDGSSQVRGLDLRAPSSGLTEIDYASQYVSSFGPDRKHVLLGGVGDDELLGGMEDDILMGGPGADKLRGNGGSDVFLVASLQGGNDTILDFSPDENDVIDLSRVLVGSSMELLDYLHVSQSGSNTVIALNFNGTGAPFLGMRLTLAGRTLTEDDLHSLVDSGHLQTGDKVLPARVNIVATGADPSENGPTSGAFTLSRSGSTLDAVAVTLQITGSAANGVDYQFLPSTVTIPAGQRSVDLAVTPYADAITELSEIVDVAILAGNGYVVGDPASAQLSIVDLMPEISIEAVEPLAVRSSQSPGLFLINRSGVLDRSVFVRLTIGGTALGGVDYTSVGSFLNLQSQQTTELIEIVPSPTASLTPGKSVQVSIQPDSTYRVGPRPTARVMLVDETMSLVQWRTRHFPESTNSIDGFAMEDPDALGIPNLLRYAYQLDPATPDPNRLPQATLRDGHLTVDTWQRVDVTDVQYEIEGTTDLLQWSSSPSLLEALPQLPDAPNIHSFRVVPSVNEQPQAFIKVRVIYQP